MQKNDYGSAQIEQIKRWSPVWIVPIVTLLIGGWILFWHYSHQGPQVTLITTNAEGIEGGKTAIKSRSVDVGIVESTVLTNDLHHVKITARLNSGMGKLLHGDSVFWVVKPTISRSGISGLGTLLSGAYIELQPGSKGNEPEEYNLLDAPPLAAPDAKGIHITLDSGKAGQLNPGDPVLFRGYPVGSVETAQFNTKKRMMTYQLFISAPYDRLVTTNVRFWKDSGIAVDMSASGMRVEMGSLTTLFSGGVSFDVPQGWDLGKLAQDNAVYRLFDDQRSIEDSLYTEHQDFLLFFNQSIRGLQPGAPVEFRGIRLGTVAEVPFRSMPVAQRLGNDYRIPVLIRIEPDRFRSMLGNDFNIDQHLKTGIQQGLRASLKTGNILTGALYVDLDFYQNVKAYKGPVSVAGYQIVPTIDGGLNQIQQKLMAVLDKINNMPIDPMINEATRALKQGQRSMHNLDRTLNDLNKIISSESMQKLPADLQQTLQDVNRSLRGVQPGSPAYTRVVSDMQRLDQVLRELQPLLRTLNTKSNALVFEANPSQDPQPKRANK